MHRAILSRCNPEDLFERTRHMRLVGEPAEGGGFRGLLSLSKQFGGLVCTGLRPPRAGRKAESLRKLPDKCKDRESYLLGDLSHFNVLRDKFSNDVFGSHDTLVHVTFSIILRSERIDVPIKILNEPLKIAA